MSVRYATILNVRRPRFSHGEDAQPGKTWDLSSLTTKTAMQGAHMKDGFAVANPADGLPPGNPFPRNVSVCENIVLLVDGNRVYY